MAPLVRNWRRGHTMAVAVIACVAILGGLALISRSPDANLGAIESNAHDGPRQTGATGARDTAPGGTSGDGSSASGALSGSGTSVPVGSDPAGISATPGSTGEHKADEPIDRRGDGHASNAPGPAAAGPGRNPPAGADGPGPSASPGAGTQPKQGPSASPDPEGCRLLRQLLTYVNDPQLRAAAASVGCL